MATARDLITKALRRAHIVATGETPQGDQVAVALDTLNDMLEAWADEGLPLGMRELEIDDALTVDRGAFRALADNLAVELADNEGVPVTSTLVTRAERGRASLQGRQFGSPNASVDPALTRPLRYDVETG